MYRAYYYIWCLSLFVLTVCAALIYVVDSDDRGRMDEAREELHRMLDEDELRDSLLLVLCNKQVGKVQDIPVKISKSLFICEN